MMAPLDAGSDNEEELAPGTSEKDVEEHQGDLGSQGEAMPGVSWESMSERLDEKTSARAGEVQLQSVWMTSWPEKRGSCSWSVAKSRSCLPCWILGCAEPSRGRHNRG